MIRNLIFPLAALVLLSGACSKNSDNDEKKIEHTLSVKFVDREGNNLFDNQSYDENSIKVVYYDSEGAEHDFFNQDWFGMNGYTVDRFYGRYVFTIYMTLPEDGGAVTETYVRLFGAEPDVYTTTYEIKRGGKKDEPYGGGTVRVKQVKLNGEIIWDKADKSEVPVEIVWERPQL